MTDQTSDVASPPARPTVVLVDDHGMFRAGVRAEIGEAVDIVGEAATVAEAVGIIGRTAPDVVLLDVHLPAGGGPAVVSAVLRTAPGTRFLALSVSDAAEDVISVIRAGARGYVTKTISGPDLIDAIRRVADGDVVFSPRLAGFVLDAFRDGTGTGPAGSASGVDPELDQLTPREQEVLRLLARGYSYREIGSELFISIKTVETHASNVLRKLQLSSRHQLTRWAAERRIV
jgi:DNA-binding NarL/FixJ family response regulator